MNVIKRNGTVESFDLNKIATVLYKVYREVGDRTKTKKICKEQAKEIIKLYENKENIQIEKIQDDVENYLMETKQFLAAKAFIKYRERKAEERMNPWISNDERQDLILGKYLIKGETKKEFLDRVTFGNYKLEKIFRNREGVWGGRNLFAIGREGNITGSNCFIKGTKVLTIDGYKNIEDIVENEQVFTHDGTYNIVSNIMVNHHEGELVKLNSKFFNNEIVTTPNHEFLTQRGWTEAKDLMVNKKGHQSPHFIKFKKLNLINTHTKKMDILEELSHIINDEFMLEDIGDRYQPKVKHNNKGTIVFTKSTIKPVNKTITMDAELAYVFGRFIGDGSLTKRKDTNHDLLSIWQIVGHENEKEQLDYCADVIERKFGIEVNRQKTIGSQKTYVIRTDSIVLSELFNKYLGHSFDKKFIHQDLMKYPEILYGAFDSDGSIDSKGTGSITMNNPELIKQLKQMSDDFGIPAYITNKINSVKKYGDYPMLVFTKNSLSLFINNIKKTYGDNRVLKIKPTNYGTVRVVDGEAYVQLDSKEYIEGNQNVYNISVEKNHDYLVDNVHVHNCYVAKDPQDSLEDIYRADYEIARTYSYGGGQGMNLSNIRPKGAKVNNSSNTTPGVMIFAEKYSHTTLNTQQESRRGALMLVMNIDHPDVIDFITAKLDLSKINGANISLAITDKFMEAYNADDIWTMSFETHHEIIKKTVRARDLMSLISYSAHTMGDPKHNWGL